MTIIIAKIMFEKERKYNKHIQIHKQKKSVELKIYKSNEKLENFCFSCRKHETGKKNIKEVLVNTRSHISFD